MSHVEHPPLRLAAMISGGGRTLLNLCDCIDRGELNAQIVCVIASREDIAGVDRARTRKLPVHVVDHRVFADEQACHDRIDTLLLESSAELVALCGWLRWLRIHPELTGRVVNIHPSLLPKFGGPGMYGNRVHQAVLDAGERESGCTVHWVDEVYDHGSVILQRRVPVAEDDTVDSLAARVFDHECIAYPMAIREVAQRLATS